MTVYGNQPKTRVQELIKSAVRNWAVVVAVTKIIGRPLNTVIWKASDS